MLLFYVMLFALPQVFSDAPRSSVYQPFIMEEGDRQWRPSERKRRKKRDIKEGDRETLILRQMYKKGNEDWWWKKGTQSNLLNDDHRLTLYKSPLKQAYEHVALFLFCSILSLLQHYIEWHSCYIPKWYAAHLIIETHHWCAIIP